MSKVGVGTILHMAREADAAEDKGRMRLVPVGEMASDTSCPDYLINKIMEANSTAQLYGASQSFKSFIALDMALCIATGRPWMGKVVKQGSVAVIAYEGEGALKRRVRAWGIHNHEDMQNVPAAIVGKPTGLASDESAEAISETLKAMKPRLVVIDTLSKAMAGVSENSAEDMNAVIRRAETYFRDAFGCAVLFIHHTGHTNTGRARGSSALHAGIDTEFFVKRVEGELMSEIKSTKMKDGEPVGDMLVKLSVVGLGYNDDEGNEITSLACDYATTMPTGVGAPAADKDDMRAVLRAIKTGGVSRKVNGKVELNKAELSRTTGIDRKRVSEMVKTALAMKGALGRLLSPRNPSKLTPAGEAFLG